MKILNYVSVTPITVVIACSFAASTTIQAQQDDARLVVSRSANFGTFQYLILYVDGVHVADFGAQSELRGGVAPRAACLIGNHDSAGLQVSTADSTTC